MNFNNNKNNKNYKNKLIHHNINNILKEDNKQQENNSCNDIKIIRKKINSNLNNYIQNKRCINKISKSYSRTVNNRQQKTDKQILRQQTIANGQHKDAKGRQLL